MEIKWQATKPHGNIIAQTMVFPKDFWPQPVVGGSEDFVYRRSWLSTLDKAVEPIGVWTFIGLDRGDIVEADVEVYTEKGIPLVLRSLHKEVPVNFDAWQYNCSPCLDPIRLIRVAATCRVTGFNTWDTLEARYHLGVVVVGMLPA